LSWDDVTKDMQETLWGFIKNITFSLLNNKKLAKMLRWKQYLMHFRGPDML
jgi:hypothetical protein